jgi:ABC-type transport system involved in multi-copper enzyme maturation permease subunit
MAAHEGLGPVFAFEWLRTARRWQVYASRSLFVSLLLIGLAGVWKSHVVDQKATSIAAMANVGRFCFQTIVLIQLVLVMLAAPAATAGAICLDKARGALVHLLATDLTNAEIVLGKLAARLVPVVGLIACALPVTALGTLLGGIDPLALTGAFAATLGVAVLGCSLALMLSIWGKKTHEVLLATYTIWLVLLLAGPSYAMFWWSLGLVWSQPDWLDRINPFVMVMGPTYWPGRFTTFDQLLFGLEMVGASAVLTVVSVRRVRAVTVRQLGQGEGRKRRYTLFGAGGWFSPSWDWLPGPALDGNPVLWREWHRNRPSGWIRLIWSLYVVSALVLSLICIVHALSGSRSNRDLAAVFNGMQVTIALLMLSVTAATSLTEERVRGSLDVLLATPLPTSAIVLGKWWGTFRNVPLLAIPPFWVAVALASQTGNWIGPFLIAMEILAYGAALTSLGLALATWVRQPGRATAISVTAYTLVTIGVVPLAMFLFRHESTTALGFAMGSPFFGVGFFSAAIGATGGRDADFPMFAGWAVLWTVFYAGVAAGLYFATLQSFDRCLGRIGSFNRPRPRPVDRKADRKPEWAALLD